MQATRSAVFENRTPAVWTFALYQSPPDAFAGVVDSVAWKLVRVAPSGGFGLLEWNDARSADLVRYDETNVSYFVRQRVTANAGSGWDVVERDGVQQLAPAGDAPPGTLRFTNRSDELASVGAGQAGSLALAQRGVYGNAGALLPLSSTYWASMFWNLRQAEIVDGNQAVTPLRLDLARASFRFVAELDGDVLVFREENDFAVAAPCAGEMRATAN